MLTGLGPTDRSGRVDLSGKRGFVMNLEVCVVQSVSGLQPEHCEHYFVHLLPLCSFSIFLFLSFFLRLFSTLLVWVLALRPPRRR